MDFPSNELSLPFGHRPLVSAVLAVRNEELHIEAALRSLLLQDTSICDLEILVIDGDSSDSTREIVTRLAALDNRVKLLINERKKTPFAFNIGIHSAAGQYVCILGAHTTYSKDYVATCLRELHLQHAGGCSGIEITRPGSKGIQSKLIAWVLAHPFGTSSGSMRTRKAGFADTIPYPIFLKTTLLEVGGYDTRLHRNQDNDLNQRLRKLGHKLYMTDRTYCEYSVSPTILSLSKYAYKAGFWNILSLRINRSSMSLRHFVPGIFIGSLMLCSLTFTLANRAPDQAVFWLRLPLFCLATTYALASLAAALHIALKERVGAAFLTPLIFLILHTCYGVGTLFAIVINAPRPTNEQNFTPEQISSI